MMCPDCLVFYVTEGSCWPNGGLSFFGVASLSRQRPARTKLGDNYTYHRIVTHEHAVFPVLRVEVEPNRAGRRTGSIALLMIQVQPRSHSNK